MKQFLFLITAMCFANIVSAQYVYTIKADSVKITNNCDTAELILENHTQNIKGFLFNKGRGRTEFRKINKLNDSTIIFGDDTTVVHGSGWRLTGNSGTNASVNYIGTNDSIDWVVRAFAKERMRVTAAGNVGIGLNIGANGSLASTKVFVAHSDTISASSQRQAHFSRTNVGTNNMTVNFGHNNGVLATSYIRLDTNTTFHADYQSGTIVGLFSSAGFLNKTNVPVQTVTAATTATNAIVTDGTKFLIQGGDTKNINGFIGGKRFIMEVNSYGTAQHYADLILGTTVRKTPGGSSYVFTNKYGLYLVPVKDGSNVTNGYSIYSEGTSDTAYLAGHARIGGTARVAKIGVNINPGSIGTAVFGAQATTSNGAFFRFFNTAGGTRFAFDLVSDDGRFDMFDNNGITKVRLQGNGISYINAGNVGINNESPAARLHVSGTGKYDSTLTTAGNRLAIVQATSNLTLNDKQECVFGDASGGAFNVTLPTASGRDGQRYTIKKTDASANAVTVNTTSSQTIDGSATYALSAQWKLVTVVSNGSNWLIVAQN